MVEAARPRPRGGGRALTGMIHNFSFREPFQKVLNELGEIYPENLLNGKIKLAQINSILGSLSSLAHHAFDEPFHSLLKAENHDKKMDPKAVQKKWTNHKSVLTKVCKGMYEGPTLPAYVTSGIRNMTHSKLKALLTRMVIVYHNHLYARKNDVQASMPMRAAEVAITTYPFSGGTPRKPEPY